MVTKQELKGLETKPQLKAQTRELKSYADRQVGNLAAMVKRGFDGVEERLDSITHQLDVRKRIDEHKRQLAKIGQA